MSPGRFCAKHRPGRNDRLLPARFLCEGRRMSLLAVKLVVTPLMVLAASLAARRWATRSVAGLSGCR
jgi:hypothetical protein